MVFVYKIWHAKLVSNQSNQIRAKTLMTNTSMTTNGINSSSIYDLPIFYAYLLHV